MRFVRVLFVAVTLLVAVRLVRADMYLEGVDGDHAMSSTNDRFYTGSDKAFIGAMYDLSGVGLSSGGSWATMISPQYFISAYHDHPGAGQTITFYEGDTTASGAHTYTVDSWSAITNFNGSPSDVYVGRLTAPIPASDNIACYPVLQLANNSSYVGMTIYNYGYPNRLGENVISSIATYTEAGESQTGMFFNYDVPGVGPSESYLMGGDSGGPSFTEVGGKLALLGEHFSNWGTSGQPVLRAMSGRPPATAPGGPSMDSSPPTSPRSTPPSPPTSKSPLSPNRRRSPSSPSARSRRCGGE